MVRHPGAIATVTSATLFSELGMASGRAQLVVRDGASALHRLLQPTASAMESDLDRGESQDTPISFAS
jgi:hypothetical protein